MKRLLFIFLKFVNGSNLKWISALLTVLLTFGSCHFDETPKKFTIGFSQCVESDAWRKTMLSEMKRELSFNDEVQFYYSEADGNSEKQIQQVKELLSKGIDLLIISPNEAEPLTPIVQETFERGIPVIVVDRKIVSPYYTAYVGADNYQIGKMAGVYAAHILQGKGSILEVTGLPKSTPAIERDRGFSEAIQKYPSLTVVKKINGEWYKQKAKEVVSKFADSESNIDLVFAQNDMMAFSTHEVYNAKSLAKPKIIGVDGLPCDSCGMQFVADKLITATMLYPTGGEEAIRVALNILNKRPYQKENPLQTLVIDSSNVRLMQLQSGKINSQQQSIEKQQSILKEQRKIYKSQRNLLYIIFSSLILAIALGGITFYSLRAKRRINKKLEARNNEIFEQKNQIEEISKKAQVANEAKVNFFTNISHEFKTPLTLIIAPLEDLMASSKNNAAQIENLNLIHKNVIRLLRLVTQLIDFRKIEVDKMPLKPTENDLIEFVSQIVQSYKSVAQKRNIDLRIFTSERELKVWFDMNMLDKVIFNLLSNAFKFTRDFGYVHIHIKQDKETNEVSINVEDNGIGMSPEVVNKLFQIFVQGDYKNNQGSGLGLALSKELIKLHQGNISVESESGKGATFTLKLPLGSNHFDENDIIQASEETSEYQQGDVMYSSAFYDNSAIKSEPQPIKVDKDCTILLIEDDEDLRAYVKRKLSVQYEIYEANTSQTALQQAFDTVPDLIISDIVIPGKDGISLVHLFKTDVRTSHIPIILLTGQANVQQQIEGMRNMADAYITKPFNVQFLEQTVKSLLTNRAMLKEHFTSELPSNLKSQSIGKIDRKFVSEFGALVESNISNEDFSVEDICKALGISRVQLYRKVKALLNINVNDYILNSRLQKAKYFLQHEESTISEIAYKVGFSSPAYFSTVFKSKFGVTPKAFKEK